MRGLAPGHHFLVCIGSSTFSFSKISGLGNELELSSINEGGVNDRMVMLYGPKKNTGRLVFEHGTGWINPMNQKFNSAMLGVFFRTPGMIISYNNYIIQRVYGYSGAMPVKWSLSAFDAQNNTLLIDTIEIAHNGVYEIPYAF